MPFTIGFDASSTLGPRRGPGRTALSLLRALQALEDHDLDLRLLLASLWRRPTAEHMALAQAGARLHRVRRPRHSLARAWAAGSGPSVQSFLGSESSVYFSPHGIPMPSGASPSAVLVSSLNLPGADPLHDAPWLTEKELPGWKRRLAQCPLVLAPTLALCDEIRAEIPDVSDHLKHLPLGLDHTSFFVENTRLVESTRQNLGIPAASYLLAVMGHGEWDRAELLLDTYATLRQREKATPPLVVMGWKGRAPAILRLRRDLHRIIHVLPHVPDARVPAIYSGAVATILTGTTGAWPHALLEAQACGSPVVASATAANLEVAAQSALLVESGSAVEWVDAVHSIAFHQDAHDRWKEAGLANAGRFHWESAAQSLVRHLRGL